MKTALLLILSATSTIAATGPVPSELKPTVFVDTSKEPIMAGPFQPTWQSLEQYEAPEWFRDAKFGLWAHWGPQCQPEEGDWYARNMYVEGNGVYKSHLQKYGHPSEQGFKDIIHSWKAEKWDPEQLVAFYKNMGARYFVAMANHHDNFDLWNSKYQEWNSVNVGPKKDLIAGWAAAAKAQGLPFGVSVHASHAWTWYEYAQMADQTGSKAGLSYDGKLVKSDGKAEWWDGLDPQDLYAQNHPLSQGDLHGRGEQWNWSHGASQPDQAYCEKFYNRTVDLINQFKPDLIYFDDTALPLWPVSDAGLQIAAHFYNANQQKSGGKSDGVLLGKILTPQQRKTMVWDIEAGVPNHMVDTPWQTCTCIGTWHYNRNVYDKDRYKTPTKVIQMLADIVSKNGNLLLNIPVRGDGSIDEKEMKIVESIGAWLKANGEAIYGTRPWKTFGEGPASGGAAMTEQGMNENKGAAATAEDFRFTRTKDGSTLYAIALGWPDGEVKIKSLGKSAGILDGEITNVSVLGVNGALAWKREDAGLVIANTPEKPNSEQVGVAVFKIALRDVRD